MSVRSPLSFTRASPVRPTIGRVRKRYAVRARLKALSQRQPVACLVSCERVLLAAEIGGRCDEDLQRVAQRSANREGRHLRIDMVAKFPVLAPRRPANTERIVIYEPKWRRNSTFRATIVREHLRTPANRERVVTFRSPPQRKRIFSC